MFKNTFKQKNIFTDLLSSKYVLLNNIQLSTIICIVTKIVRIFVIFRKSKKILKIRYTSINHQIFIRSQYQSLYREFNYWNETIGLIRNIK